MGVLNAIQTRVQPLRARRQSRIQSRKGDIFLEDDENIILEHVTLFPSSCCRKFRFSGNFEKLYPLCVVVSRPKVSLELVQAVHQAYPEAMSGALQYALEKRQRNLDILNYIVQQAPEESSTRDNMGRLPIHTALQNQARLDVIKFLVEEYPQGLREREFNNSQRIPIHIALEEQYSFVVIQYLVTQYKEALQQADYDIQAVVEQEGWLVHQGKFHQDLKCGLPLHTACKRKASLKVVKYLVNSYPTAVSTKNRAGWLPLHFACAFGADPVVIEYLLTACPDALLERTNCLFTEYPTHLAAGRPNADLETLKLLVGKHPVQSNKQPDSTIYASYLDGARNNEAHPIILRFLRHVVRAADLGYSYLPTREDCFCATARSEPYTRNSEQSEDGMTTMGTESTILLGQVCFGS